MLMAPKMGKDGHVLTFPVSHGAKLNVVAFHTSSDDWDNDGNTKVSSREDALQDFAGFGKAVTSILKLTEEEPTVVRTPFLSYAWPTELDIKKLI